ncbi:MULTISPECIES: DUF4437 domain-containing protein [Bradyrhizobium]|uniref:DUF4437 domain-containing protein n=1 Tax=Bradyrhizobium elkanii TaxID=29448 RepID=UPI0004155F63|nr:DUF4437 domain-containing protein [Bradyrhizobium elkanii]
MFKKKVGMAAVAGVLLLAASASTLAAQDASRPAHEGPSVSTPADQIKFVNTGIKTDKGELPAYGNLQKGRHGTFLRMPAGFVSPAHTHTEDYYAVVIKGVGANRPPGANAVPLPVGSYWFQTGEEAHVTECLSKTECLFFLVQPGKFDFAPAK